MTAQSLERMMTTFRGDRSREVGREDFINALADVLGLSLLKDAARAGDNRVRPPSLNYSANEVFWRDSLTGRHREGSSVRLEGFHITEWTPYSPGRYYTQNAAEARRRAKGFVSHVSNEYLPLGKMNMMLGGVGSVRLKGRTIEGQQYYFLGASSTGISHQGIPLIVPESQHARVMDIIIQSGGCYTNITGQMRVMPPELSLISYSQSVPKYFLLAQSVEPREPSPANFLLATASVMYSGSYDESHGEAFEMDGFSTKLRKGWTFCSFNPSDGIQAIMSAAEWLRDYAGRYSEEGSDPLLSDFDEHHQYFESPVEFPIGRIVDRSISLERLHVYGRHYGFQIIAKEVNVSIFSNISNSTIINESEVKDSFNKIAREKDEATAKALLQIAEEIERSGNAEAGALFHTFNTELQKDNSNKTVLKTLWDGVVEQLPNIGSMVEVVKKIATLFA